MTLRHVAGFDVELSARQARQARAYLNRTGGQPKTKKALMNVIKAMPPPPNATAKGKGKGKGGGKSVQVATPVAATNTPTVQRPKAKPKAKPAQPNVSPAVAFPVHLPHYDAQKGMQPGNHIHIHTTPYNRASFDYKNAKSEYNEKLLDVQDPLIPPFVPIPLPNAPNLLRAFGRTGRAVGQAVSRAVEQPIVRSVAPEVVGAAEAVEVGAGAEALPLIAEVVATTTPAPIVAALAPEALGVAAGTMAAAAGVGYLMGNKQQHHTGAYRALRSMAMEDEDEKREDGPDLKTAVKHVTETIARDIAEHVRDYAAHALATMPVAGPVVTSSGADYYRSTAGVQMLIDDIANFVQQSTTEVSRNLINGYEDFSNAFTGVDLNITGGHMPMATVGPVTSTTATASTRYYFEAIPGDNQMPKWMVQASGGICMASDNILANDVTCKNTIGETSVLMHQRNLSLIIGSHMIWEGPKSGMAYQFGLRKDFDGYTESGGKVLIDDASWKARQFNVFHVPSAGFSGDSKKYFCPTPLTGFVVTQPPKHTSGGWMYSNPVYRLASCDVIFTSDSNLEVEYVTSISGDSQKTWLSLIGQTRNKLGNLTYKNTVKKTGKTVRVTIPVTERPAMSYTMHSAAIALDQALINVRVLGMENVLSSFAMSEVLITTEFKFETRFTHRDKDSGNPIKVKTYDEVTNVKGVKYDYVQKFMADIPTVRTNPYSMYGMTGEYDNGEYVTDTTRVIKEFDKRFGQGLQTCKHFDYMGNMRGDVKLNLTHYCTKETAKTYDFTDPSAESHSNCFSVSTTTRKAFTDRQRGLTGKNGDAVFKITNRGEILMPYSFRNSQYNQLQVAPGYLFGSYITIGSFFVGKGFCFTSELDPTGLRTDPRPPDTSLCARYVKEGVTQSLRHVCVDELFNSKSDVVPYISYRPSIRGGGSLPQFQLPSYQLSTDGEYLCHDGERYEATGGQPFQASGALYHFDDKAKKIYDCGHDVAAGVEINMDNTDPALCAVYSQTIDQEFSNRAATFGSDGEHVDRFIVDNQLGDIVCECLISRDVMKLKETFQKFDCSVAKGLVDALSQTDLLLNHTFDVHVCGCSCPNGMRRVTVGSNSE